jgi:hypothetical protein
VVSTRVQARERGLFNRMKIPLAAVVFRRQFRGHYKVLAQVLAEGSAEWREKSEATGA